VKHSVLPAGPSAPSDQSRFQSDAGQALPGAQEQHEHRQVEQATATVYRTSTSSPGDISRSVSFEAMLLLDQMKTTTVSIASGRIARARAEAPSADRRADLLGDARAGRVLDGGPRHARLGRRGRFTSHSPNSMVPPQTNVRSVGCSSSDEEQQWEEQQPAALVAGEVSMAAWYTGAAGASGSVQIVADSL
jgi:hypothetical protein